MKPQRRRVEPIRQPTLFQIEKLENAAELTSQFKIERPYSLPGILLGTSAFIANGWQGSFYPAGMKPADYLKFYSTRFQTVEVDSTFYGAPSAATVEKWYTPPPDFVFAAKVPRVVTHDKLLVDCDSEFEEYGLEFSEMAKSMGIHKVLTAPRSPFRLRALQVGSACRQDTAGRPWRCRLFQPQ